MNAQSPQLDDYIDADALRALLATAKREDVGPDALDVTSTVMIPADRTGVAAVAARHAGVLAGAVLLDHLAPLYDRSITIKHTVADGETISAGQTAAELTGPFRGLLAMERVALNFLCHLSGVASLTAAFVERIAGTKAGIYDTRKTIPGVRGLEKYAVACGGGRTHRIGLFDAVLIKDNHLSGVLTDDLAAVIARAAKDARAANTNLKFVEVEVDSLDQLEHVLAAPVDVVLLDNMPPNELRQAVAMRDRLAQHVELEASGGVTLDNVRAIAEAGVERISVGALTHSAPALDIGLDIVSQS